MLPEFCETVERFCLVFFPFGTSVESLLPVTFLIILFTQLFHSVIYYFSYLVYMCPLLCFKSYFSFLLVSFLRYNANTVYKRKTIKVEKYFLVIIMLADNCYLADVLLSLKS